MTSIQEGTQVPVTHLDLYKISEKYDKNDISLYRDDGLAVFKNISGPKSECIKKNFQSLFKKYGLEIIIECNKKVVDFLDVTFNLKDGTYKPYQKPDNKISYINVQSNHPPNIIKQLPKIIEQRLSNNSTKLPRCTKKRFPKQVTMSN